LWWVQPNHLSTPLVTTTSNPNATNPAGFNVAAGLGQPGTSILVGTNDLTSPAIPGFRLTLGGWLDSEATIGIEGRGFYLQPTTTTRTFSSDANGNPMIGIPIIDVAGLFGGGENAIIASSPVPALGLGKGSDSVTSRVSLFGFETNAAFNLFRSCAFTVDFLAGYRYAQLQDEINLTSTTTNLPGNFVTFLGHAYDGTVSTTDTWQAKNVFNGGNLGLRGQLSYGRFYTDLSGRVAIGSTHQTLEISGLSTLQANNGTQGAANGGILTGLSNIGSYSRNTFSVIPEFELKLGVNLTERISVFVGYNYMVWTNVARSGGQIDRSVDVRTFPISPVFTPGIRSNSPAPEFNSSTFWAQGLAIGMQVRY
jgi:hypothetical protein